MTVVAASSAVVFAVGAFAAREAASRSPAAGVRGLIVAYGDGRSWTVSLLTLTGKKLPVPASVSSSPLGLSPDGRYVARIPGWNPFVLHRGSDGVVELGPVKGGSLKTVLHGTDPSFAWSPDGRQLAASANGRTGPTMLRVFDRSGHLVRSLTLPRVFQQEAERAFYRVLSWSPDGSRLLLEESDPYLPRAIVALDLRAERLLTLAIFGNKDEPDSVVWSPDGTYVALAGGEGFSQDDYLFAVIDVASGTPLMQCTVNHHCPVTLGPPLAWAPDGRSLFGVAGAGVVRLDLAWHHSTVATVRLGSIFRLSAFARRLVYNVAIWRNNGTTVSDTLYLQELGTQERRQLLQVRGGYRDVGAVRTITRLP